MNVYSFDVDHTLEPAGGPIPLQMLMDLRVQGHIVGLCGNWAPIVAMPGWQHLVSFFNVGMPKEAYLAELKKYIKADDYIHVGNVGPNDTVYFNQPQTGGSDDMSAAFRAYWRFIKESDFMAGVR